MSKTTLVIDTSVMVKWLSADREKNLDRADKILTDSRKGLVELVAPELAKYEIGNVLLLSKKLSSKQGIIVLNQFFMLPITFVIESEEIAKLTYNLAFDLGITYYDAAFLSLAKQYNATLITENIKHLGKTRKVKILSLANYSM